MEHASAEDFAKLEDVERKGLGTPATRAAMIEKLVKSGFVERKEKLLVPTEKGAALACRVQRSAPCGRGIPVGHFAGIWRERGCGMNLDEKRRTENYLAAAEMSEEGNYNQIDGIVNNEAPKSSLVEALRQHQEQREEYERQKETTLEQTRGTRHGEGR